MKEYVVYMHTVPNGRRYIGITCQNTERRWRGGMFYDYNRRFFSVIVKYGWDNIKHEILYSGLTKEQAETKEIELIAEYKTHDEEYGYNQTVGGTGAKGCSKSIETREKLSKANKGRKMSDSVREKMKGRNIGRFVGGKSASAKKVCQYDLQGNLIKIWDSQSDAARAFSVAPTNILAACKHLRKTVKGYKWEYYKEGE